MAYYLSHGTRQALCLTFSQTLRMPSGAFLAHRVLTFLRMGVAAGVASVLSQKLRQRHPDTDRRLEHRLALRHFQTSSLWPVPRDYQGPAWNIWNDYPRRGEPQFLSLHSGNRATSRPPSGAPKEMPWSLIDFKADPLAFCQVVKQYCWEGNVKNRFVVQKNSVRLLTDAS